MDLKKKEYELSILNLIKENKFIKAKKNLEYYLRKFHDQYDFILRICNICQELKRKKQFLYFTKILYSEFPHKIDSYSLYAQALFNNSQFKSADKILKEAIYILDNPIVENKKFKYYQKFLIALKIKHFIRKIELMNKYSTNKIEKAEKYREDLMKQQTRLHCAIRKPMLFAIPYIIDPIESYKKEKYLEYKYEKKLLDEPVVKLNNEENDKLKGLLCPNAVITKNIGVYDKEGNPFHNSVLRRDSKRYPNGFPIKIDSNSIKISKTFDRAFYITYFNTHFGHLITEGISAISLLMYFEKIFHNVYSELPIIIHRKYKNYADVLEDLFHLNKGDILIPGINCGDLFIRNLYLSSPTVVLRSWSSRSHSNCVKTYFSRLNNDKNIQSNNLPKNSKIYISRSKLADNLRRMKDEEIFENNLIKLGWHIFHPQEHSIDSQIKTYENASFICSQHSSALHLLYAVNTKKIKKIIILHFGLYENYYFQFKTQEIEFKDILCLKREKVQDADVEFSEDYALNELPKLIENYCNL